MYTPPVTRRCTEVCSSGFDTTYFYQYIDDHFSHLNPRLDDIDEQQKQHAQDQHDLLCQQMPFDRRQRNLEHHVYYAYEHHGWPYPPPNWRPSSPRPIRMLCEFFPLPFLYSFCFMILIIALRTTLVLSMGLS